MRRKFIALNVTGFMLIAGGALAADNPRELPPGPNRALVYGQCRTCHDLQYLTESAGINRQAWDDIIDSMKQYGLRIPADQRAKILDYLATYLGPNPPPPDAAAATPAGQSKTIDGAEVYRNQCISCHQADGEGVRGQFPPLARNSDLFLAQDFPVRVVLHGIEGKIDVQGQSYDGVMPALDILSDDEIAAVVNYVRTQWGNDALRPTAMAPVNAALVKELRGGKAMSAEDVHAYRETLTKSAPHR